MNLRFQNTLETYQEELGVLMLRQNAEYLTDQAQKHPDGTCGTFHGAYFSDMFESVLQFRSQLQS